MNRGMRWFLGLAIVAVSRAGAQIVPPARPSSADSVFSRARQLVVNGNGAAGRLLIDSVVAGTDPETPIYAEALYWRAALAATSADAEQDYRRVVVEYPQSARAGDALYQLAQLEIARGDRVAATTHLDRFLLDNPTSTDRGRAGLMLVRLSFEQGDLQHGCNVLRRALTDVPAAEVELHNQLDYYSPRCVNVDSTRAAPTSAAGASSPRDSARSDSTRRNTAGSDSTKRASSTAAHASGGRYTLQVAAYSTQSQADGLAKRLKARGLDVRVVGTASPFRVRIGRYATRAAATTAARELKARNIETRITEIGRDDK